MGAVEKFVDLLRQPLKRFTKEELINIILLLILAGVGGALFHFNSHDSGTSKVDLTGIESRLDKLETRVEGVVKTTDPSYLQLGSSLHELDRNLAVVDRGITTQHSELTTLRRDVTSLETRQERSVQDLQEALEAMRVRLRSNQISIDQRLETIDGILARIDCVEGFLNAASGSCKRRISDEVPGCNPPPGPAGGPLPGPESPRPR